jgi:hypothetical protein
MDIIKWITSKQAKKAGISRTNLFYLKEKVRKGKKVKLKKKILSKLLKLSCV